MPGEQVTMGEVAARLSRLVDPDDSTAVVAALESQRAKLLEELSTDEARSIRRAELELTGIESMLVSLRG